MFVFGSRLLDLSFNFISGTVPSGISSLSLLSSLSLDSNLLVDDIAAFRPLPALQSLSVQDNDLIGSLTSLTSSTVLTRLQYVGSVHE